VVDLDREQDIEELRRIAQAQQTQIRILLDALAIKSKEIDALKGKSGDVQLTLKMLEALQAKAKAADEALAKAEAAQRAKQKPARKPRMSSGPTEQPNLPIVEKEFLLDDADRVCPSCGGGLSPMTGQYDESEMIDVVEVSYRLVKVKQQKYVCRCGSCVETALGPERALAGSRYSLAFAIKVILDKWLDHSVPRRHGRIVMTTN
jgi:transposase